MEIVRQKDNLRLEGKFEGRVQEKWYPADKPVVARLKDNITVGMDGEFEKRPVHEWAPGTRAPIVRCQDNLRLDPLE